MNINKILIGVSDITSTSALNLCCDQDDHLAIHSALMILEIPQDY